jgi:hypothetical protein
MPATLAFGVGSLNEPVGGRNQYQMPTRSMRTVRTEGPTPQYHAEKTTTAHVEGILSELEAVPHGSAPEIPLADVAIGLANVRSAVRRGATADGIEIETLAGEKNFYVFKKAVR